MLYSNSRLSRLKTVGWSWHMLSGKHSPSQSLVVVPSRSYKHAVPVGHFTGHHLEPSLHVGSTTSQVPQAFLQGPPQLIGILTFVVVRFRSQLQFFNVALWPSTDGVVLRGISEVVTMTTVKIKPTQRKQHKQHPCSFEIPPILFMFTVAKIFSAWPLHGYLLLLSFSPSLFLSICVGGWAPTTPLRHASALQLHCTGSSDSLTSDMTTWQPEHKTGFWYLCTPYCRMLCY